MAHGIANSTEREEETRVGEGGKIDFGAYKYSALLNGAAELCWCLGKIPQRVSSSVSSLGEGDFGRLYWNDLICNGLM